MGNKSVRIAPIGALLLLAYQAQAIEPVTFSVERGWHDAAFSLELLHPDASATVVYTLDGADPRLGIARSYDGPIAIDGSTVVRAAALGASETSAPVTHTYLFMPDVLSQPDLAPDYPVVWAGQPADYGMDPEITEDPATIDGLITGLRSLPTVSLAIAPDELFDPLNGIYVNATEEGDGWERPVSIEWFDDVDSWQVNSGIQMHGGASRLPTSTPKKGFRVEFKGIYGPTKLDFDVFGGQATQSFDSLVLKPTFNHSWVSRREPVCECRRHAQYLRDAFVRTEHRAMGQLAAHSRPVHMFLNGMYWGLYHVVERPDAAFAASYLGGDKEEWDALNAGEPVDGDRTAWFEALDRAEADLSELSAYDALLEVVDETSLITFMIVNHWVASTDWDDRNWYAVRRRADGERWRFLVWDAEFVMAWPDQDVSEVVHEGRPTSLHAALQASDEYRIHFADQVHDYLVGDGAFTDDAAIATFLDLGSHIDLPIYGESARWGDHRRDVNPVPWPAELYTREDHWLVEQDRLITEWFPGRAQFVIDRYVEQDLFPELGAPVASFPPDRVPPGTILDLTADAEIWYTRDGTDPRGTGGGISPRAEAWTGPMSLNTAIDLFARTWDGDAWSPRLRNTWTVDQPFEDLIIDEIHYNPASDGVEFVELFNRGALPIALAGLSASDGIDWQAPLDLVVPPGEFVVLTEDLDAFEARYGVPADGRFDKHLANEGETLALSDGDGTVVVSVTWDDEPPWDPAPDGQGPSLSLLGPDHDTAAAASWVASTQTGGTPGAVNFAPPPPLTTPPDAVVPQDEADPSGCSGCGGGRASLFPWMLLLLLRGNRAPVSKG